MFHRQLRVESCTKNKRTKCWLLKPFPTQAQSSLLACIHSLGRRGAGERQRSAVDNEFLQLIVGKNGAVGALRELEGGVPRERRREGTPQVVAFRSARIGG